MFQYYMLRIVTEYKSVVLQLKTCQILTKLVGLSQTEF